MRGTYLLRFTLLIALLLLLSVPFLAQTTAEHALTNADITRMIKAGVPESIIVREIQMSKSNFNTAPVGIIELKNQGASERILGAVLDSRSAGSRSAAAPLPDTKTPSTASGIHHLPNFQADLKIKSNSVAKVSMTQNHIKVDRAGMPLFDLKWKEKPAR